MAEISMPKEFLTEAMQAAEALEEKRARLAAAKMERERAEEALLTLQKNIDKEKTAQKKARRDGVSGEYDKQLRAVDAEIREVGERRAKARTAGVRTRIAEQTAALHEENKKLQKELQGLFRRNQIPGFCRSWLYYALYMPRGIREIGTAALLFAVCFCLLPFGVIKLLPKRPDWIWMLVYPLVILLFGGIYVFVGNRTKLPHKDVIAQGRGIRSHMAANAKKIRVITRNIRSDRDDTLYDLKTFDDQLTRLSQKRENIETQKTEALNQFDTVTANVLADEIDSRYREERAALSEQEKTLSEETERLKDLCTEEALRMTDRYAQYIGAQNLTKERIGQMLSCIENGEAKSVAEAAAKMQD